MAWHFSGGRPIYLQISEQIVSDILAGKYKMGEKLPSVREFAVLAAVNPNTMQRALTELEDFKLVETQRNTGRFVTQDESVLDAARKKRAEEYGAEYLRNMTGLGYSPDQAAEILQTVHKGEVSENGRDS